MIKNVIFDLGNVVLKLRWDIVLNRYSDNADDKKLLDDVIFNSEEWQRLDAGTIEKYEAINIMKSKLPSKLHDACLGIMKDWKDGFVINTEILDFIDFLKSNGYKTYILSNAPLDLPDYLSKHDLDKYFIGKVISAEEKMTKPNKEIYELLLNRFSLNPEECLFLDDKPENIQGAISCKMNGYVFDYNNFNKFLEDINKLYNI